MEQRFYQFLSYALTHTGAAFQNLAYEPEKGCSQSSEKKQLCFNVLKRISKTNLN